MNSVFLMNLDTAEEFWKRCIAVNATTLDEKNKILLEMMSEKKALYMGETKLSPPELTTELIKKGIRARSYTKKVGK